MWEIEIKNGSYKYFVSWYCLKLSTQNSYNTLSYVVIPKISEKITGKSLDGILIRITNNIK